MNKSLGFLANTLTATRSSRKVTPENPTRREADIQLKGTGRDAVWMATSVEYPDVQAHGDTQAEAQRAINATVAAWMRGRKRLGLFIPERATASAR